MLKHLKMVCCIHRITFFFSFKSKVICFRDLPILIGKIFDVTTSFLAADLLLINSINGTS